MTVRVYCYVVSCSIHVAFLKEIDRMSSDSRLGHSIPWRCLIPLEIFGSCLGSSTQSPKCQKLGRMSLDSVWFTNPHDLKSIILYYRYDCNIFAFVSFICACRWIKPCDVINKPSGTKSSFEFESSSLWLRRSIQRHIIVVAWLWRHTHGFNWFVCF